MPKKGEVEEEERLKKAVIEAFEVIIKEKYGIDIRDVSARFNKINELIHGIDRKVDALRSQMEVIDTKVGALDKRIDDWRDATKTYFVVLGLVVAVAGILVPILLRIL